MRKMAKEYQVSENINLENMKKDLHISTLAKINAEVYVSQILKPLCEAASKHFKGEKWTFQQDGATSHISTLLSREFSKI